MANVRVLLLFENTIISKTVEQWALRSNLACQTALIDEWPWHDPQLMGQKIRQSGVSTLIFTGLIENPLRHWPALQELAESCHQSGVSLILCSTNEVFSAQQGGLHTEKDVPDPNSQFGIEALAAESIIAQYCPRHLILRVGWIFSGESPDLLTYLLGSIELINEIKAPSGFKITPLHVTDFAKVLIAIVEQSALTETLWGTYHYSSADSIDLYHFYEAVLSEAKQYDSLTDIRLSLDETVALPNVLALKGGLLSGKKLMYHFGIKPKAWRPAMAKTLKHLFAKA
jgi:dTDP-4-dehydrorhamnose reductase